MAVSTSPPAIALVSMPWSPFNRPSVQLGALKAYIEGNSDITVDCFHPYLSAAQDLGTDLYTQLARNSWAGEALYAALLFPERREQAAKVFRKSCADFPELSSKFYSIHDLLQKHLHDWIAETDFKRYLLIGFSVCFSQLFASLAAAGMIKKTSPGARIVFGGSSCAGDLGKSLKNRFSQIDHVVAGEGEKPLMELCRILGRDGGHRSSAAAVKTWIGPETISQLDDLPAPDYHPYFNELELFFPGKPFSPVLPIEFSRGCWWRRCTFCNLNLQWHGYRHKSAAKMIAEVKELQGRHHCLDFTFCDNALPLKETDSFFSAILKWAVDVQFFAEIRAIHDPEKLALYRRSGLTAVQVGIESFSNSLLAKMKKGTTVIENLAVMKYCAENSIALDGNVITEFPGSSESEVEETLQNLAFALPYRPLSAASFFLGSGSAVDKNPGEFCIREIISHHHYKNLLPPDILEDLDLLIKDYRGGRSVQRRRWQPVREMIRNWQDFHKKQMKDAQPPLSFRDGGTFLLIRQVRPEGPPLLHRLRGTSRKIYLFCRVVRNLEEITRRFPELPQKSLLNFFHDLAKKHLLYQEDKQFLALAIRTRQLHQKNLSG